jgi:hypothetical protein
MAGKKGQKAWNKREEYDWRDLIQENKTLLFNLAKRFRVSGDNFSDESIAEIMNDPNKRRLFFKALDIASAVVVKSMPQKIEGDGVAPVIQISWKDSDEKMSILRA